MPDVTTTTTTLTRRGLLARAGVVGATALGAGWVGAEPAEASQNKRVAFGPTPAQRRFVVGDTDILTFALNTEYFEAEFYLRAVNGDGLPAALTTGGQGYGPTPYRAAVPGTVSTYAAGTPTVTTGANAAVPFADPTIRQFAQEIAEDESQHVSFLRKALGKKAPARPTIDLAGAFTAFMRTAGVIGPTDTFDPFLDQRHFLLAAFLINDVGPTAYVGAAPYLASPANVEAAAGILGTEAYHAGETRTLIFATAQETGDQDLIAQAGAIANLRNNVAILGGAPNPTDLGVVNADLTAHIVPADADSIVFPRGFPAVLSLFYQSATATLTPTPGGFTPSGFNGRIR